MVEQQIDGNLVAVKDVEDASRQASFRPKLREQHGCRWVTLAVEPGNRSVWTRQAPGTIQCPIAHGEGCYVHPDPDALAAGGQVVVRYRGGNPNGSVADIAGVCDETGLVLGLMPHPENHVVRRQHPRHRHDATTAARLGIGLFRSAVAHVS